MEPTYVLFRTAGGCLFGLVSSILYFVLGVLVLVYVPKPMCV